MSTSYEPMTAEDLAEAREWLKAPACGDFRSDVKTAFLYLGRLLATVDALTERAERAEGERDVLKGHCRDLAKQRDDLASLFGPVCKERDEALAAKERAEAERDRWHNAATRRQGHIETLKQEVTTLSFGLPKRVVECAGCKEALALADARGRALEMMVNAHIPESHHAILAKQDLYPHNSKERVANVHALRALSLPAPQALAQHQERMSGLIEALEFYADRESYRVETDILNEDYPVMADQGDTAREALDALKKGK